MYESEKAYGPARENAREWILKRLSGIAARMDKGGDVDAARSRVNAYMEEKYGR